MATAEQKNINSRNAFLNRYFNLILAVVVIFVLFFGFLLFIQPKFNETKLLIRSNIDNQKKLYAQQKLKLDSLRVLNELYGKIPTDDINKFNHVLPSKYQVESLFGEFEDIINQGGWTLNSISWLDLQEEDKNMAIDPSAEKSLSEKSLEGSSVGVIELNLSLSNLDYSGVKKLIKTLENNLRLFDIVSVNFSGESSAQIVIYTYYYEK